MLSRFGLMIRQDLAEAGYEWTPDELEQIMRRMLKDCRDHPDSWVFEVLLEGREPEEKGDSV